MLDRTRRLEHVVPAARGVVVDHSVEAFSVDDVELILCGGREHDRWVELGIGRGVSGQELHRRTSKEHLRFAAAVEQLFELGDGLGGDDAEDFKLRCPLGSKLPCPERAVATLGQAPQGHAGAGVRIRELAHRPRPSSTLRASLWPTRMG